MIIIENTIFKPNIKKVAKFTVSGLISGIIDAAIFTIISFLTPNNALYSLLATVSARIVSSLVNFFINFKYVFNGKNSKSVARYYILWAFQLSVSYGNVVLFSHVIGLPRIAVKLIGDLILSLASFVIQKKWVFTTDMKKNYHGLVAILLPIIRLFSKKYTVDFEMPDKPVVYVCRHLKMHAPYTLVKWMPDQPRPLVLDTFFNKKKCYDQLVGYTFKPKDKEAGIRTKLLSAFLCHIMVAGVKQIGAIEVHRSSSFKAVNTIKDSVKALESGSNIVVFADIDYNGNYEKPSDIYKGFLLIGELFKKKTGNSVEFVCLYIDDDAGVIRRSGSVIVDSKETMDSASEKIKEYINR